ncbi:MAG: hypothetical protein V4598_07830 [Bdellovibrionota bacterium]
MSKDKSLRIFVVENDHQTRVDLRRFYEGMGHEVLSSATSAEALRILDHILKPDLFLIGNPFSGEMFSFLSNSERFRSIPVASILR